MEAIYPFIFKGEEKSKITINKISHSMVAEIEYDDLPPGDGPKLFIEEEQKSNKPPLGKSKKEFIVEQFLLGKTTKEIEAMGDFKNGQVSWYISRHKSGKL